ncbi:UNVERIFIED_CONTAM: hypothetical protein Sradi_7244100 [Sesamum radiatum]|uniref:Cytochrome oxidase subunit II copper A binding domain-containing protein n=1 Tax=Sesamum radiatum TaxID=300843 RepID=A0AAW2IN40_SESRA
MEDPFSAVIPFLKAPQELVAVQEMLPQGPQNPPLEVVEGPSTFNDLRRLEVDSRLVIPANTHWRNIVTSVDIAHSVARSEEGASNEALGGQSEAAETASTGPSRGASWTIIAAVGN